MCRPAGNAESDSPAPNGNSVTSAGTSTTAQCQKPLGVGASGSYMLTMKLCVLSGKPDQLSSGDWSWPPAPKMALHWGEANLAPSATVLLVRRKSGAGGRSA